VQIPQMPAAEQLGFGNYPAPIVFMMEHDGNGWVNARLEPYNPAEHGIRFSSEEVGAVTADRWVIGWVRQNFGASWRKLSDPQVLDRLTPEGVLSIEALASRALKLAEIHRHYGLGHFEGLKAYSGHDGIIRRFRADQNAKRQNQACVRMKMPQIPEALWLSAVDAVVAANAKAGWIPTVPGYSLYIRPVMEAVNEALSVRPGTHFRFFIICCPVGAYYPGGMHANDLFVETDRARVPPGGLGSVKARGNYADMEALDRAKAVMQRIDPTVQISQLIWLAAEDFGKPPQLRRLEEVGTSNLGLRYLSAGESRFMTPCRDRGTILPSVVMDSCLELLRLRGSTVVTGDDLTLQKLIQLAEGGQLQELLGAGTAAVTSPTGRIHAILNGKYHRWQVGDGQIGAVTQWLYDRLTAMQYGHEVPPNSIRDWIVEVPT